MGSEAIVVDGKCAARGIAIIWNAREASLSNFSATQHYLLATFHILGTSIKGFMANVYAPPMT